MRMLSDLFSLWNVSHFVHNQQWIIVINFFSVSIFSSGRLRMDRLISNFSHQKVLFGMRIVFLSSPNSLNLQCATTYFIWSLFINLKIASTLLFNHNIFMKIQNDDTCCAWLFASWQQHHSQIVWRALDVINRFQDNNDLCDHIYSNRICLNDTFIHLLDALFISDMLFTVAIEYAVNFRAFTIQFSTEYKLQWSKLFAQWNAWASNSVFAGGFFFIWNAVIRWSM